jgi:hypothetical protein
MAMAYGNRSLAVHLARGVIGIGALVLALRGYTVIGWPALLLVGVTLWMLKGCPVCWTIGLFETLAFKIFASAEGAALGRGDD